jgi:hypothetical protein
VSKASEWALINDTADLVNQSLGRTFRLNHPEQRGRVMVERDGNFYLEIRHDGIASVGGSMRPKDAVALAEWILDTFGEETP